MTIQHHQNIGGRSLLRAAILAAGLAALPTLAMAQYAVVGSLGNFDAANFEGKDAHGMEIQIEGIQPSDLTPSWCGNKYSCPIVTPYATGVYVRYVSSYDAANSRFTATTVPKVPGPFSGTCYQWSPTYLSAGCDHFGVHIAYTAASRAIVSSYRWLFEDPANPGTLIPSTTNIFIPTPVYTLTPPAVPTQPPVLVVVVQTPPPPPPPPARPPQYGDATWMKVFKIELNRDANLDELTTDNPVETAANVETSWVLMQPEPPSDGRRKGRNRHQNQGGVGPGVRSVLRRYETYAYTGAYDPNTHQAVCGGDATCSTPQPGELGDMITAQMAAANVNVPSLTINLAGAGGQVVSSDNVLSCGNKCATNYAPGTVVSLTAKAGSGSAFTGWGGAAAGCGQAATCSVTVNDAVTVSASFAAQYTLSVGRSNSGTITSDVAGINCGGTCSAKYTSGTVVTLTAIPPAGKTFANWSNGGAACGTSLTCTVTMTANLSVQANFNK